jgi:hypothetical protein
MVQRIYPRIYTPKYLLRVCDGDVFIRTASPDEKSPHTGAHIQTPALLGEKLRTDAGWLMNIGRISDLGRRRLAHDL